MESGAPQPTQADLRRAVSTAYYTLFHCLAGTAADLLTGANRDPEWHQVYRALEHGKAKSACRRQEVMRTFPLEAHSFAKALVDKTWREGKDDLGYPYLRLIAKSDIGQRDPATV